MKTAPATWTHAIFLGKLLLTLNRRRVRSAECSCWLVSSRRLPAGFLKPAFRPRTLKASRGADPDKFTSGELARFFLVCRSVLYKYEEQWYLWRQGILSDEMWQSPRRWAKACVLSSGQPSRGAGKAAAAVHGRIHRIGRHHDCVRESEHSRLKILRIPTAFFGKSRGIRI